MSWYSGRRGFLRALGAASTGLLAGCTAGDSEEQSLASQSAGLLGRLPKLTEEEYKGDVLKVESFIPEKIGTYRDTMPYLQVLNQAVPLSFDVDIESATEGFVTLDRTVVSLTAPEGESFADSITSPGTEAGSVGSYTVYEHGTGLLALDDNRLLFVRPSDRVTIGTREVLERVVDAETEDGETSSTDREKVAVETVEAVDADHYLAVAVPFGQDVFREKTEYVSGARAVAWGLTAEEKDTGGASVTSRIAARFPSGEAEKGPLLPYIHNSMPVWVDITSTSVDGDMVTAHQEDGTPSRDGGNQYLRPRGLSNPLFVNVRSTKTEWLFDYPNYGVTGAEEMVVPVDRTTVVGAISEEITHKFGAPAVQLGVEVDSDWYRYQKVTPSETGDFQIRCYFLHEDKQEHTAKLSVVDTAGFEGWIANQ